MPASSTIPDHLSRRRKLLFSIGDLSTSIPLAILMFFQLFFLTDVAGLNPAYAAWAVGIPRIWDAINDPLFGLVSDRIRTRWGRRRVLLLFGAVPLGLTFMLMWLVPSFGQAGLALYYATVFILFDTVFTLVHVGYNALTPEMTSDYDERSSLNGYRMAFSIAGTLGAIILATVLGWYIADLQVRFAVTGVILGLLAMIPPLIVFRITRERPSDELPPSIPIKTALVATLSNRPFRWVMGLYLLSWTTASILAAVLIYFANYYLRVPEQANYFVLIAEGAAILFIPFWVWVAQRLDKRRAFILGAASWIVVLLAIAAAGGPGDAGVSAGRAPAGDRHGVRPAVGDGAGRHRVRPVADRRAPRRLLLCLRLLLPEAGDRRGAVDDGPSVRDDGLPHPDLDHGGARAAAGRGAGDPPLRRPGARGAAGAGDPMRLAVSDHAREPSGDG